MLNASEAIFTSLKYSRLGERQGVCIWQNQAKNLSGQLDLTTIIMDYTHLNA
jgi:hypothetical protein